MRCYYYTYFIGKETKISISVGQKEASMWRPLGEEQLLHLSDDQMMQSFPNLVLVLKWEEDRN